MPIIVVQDRKTNLERVHVVARQGPDGHTINRVSNIDHCLGEGRSYPYQRVSLL